MSAVHPSAGAHRSGAELLAVEPVAGMRAQLRAAVPGVAVLEGTAGQIPLPDESVDAVHMTRALCGRKWRLVLFRNCMWLPLACAIR